MLPRTILDRQPHVPEPDLYLIALDHPAFGAKQDSQLSLEDQLQKISDTYGDPKEGALVTVIEPEDDRMIEMSCLEVKDSTVLVGLESYDWRLAGKMSIREVSKKSIFAGFPCIAVLPSFPLRLLKLAIAGRCAGTKGMWPEPLRLDEICVQVDGIPIEDEEFGVGQIMKLVNQKPRARVEVCLGRGRRRTGIPWVPKG